MSSVRTTISCRLFAQRLTLASAILLATASAGGGSDERPQLLPTEVKWSVVLSAPVAAAPVFGEDHIYIALQSGIVAAHGIADGAEVWRREIRTNAPLAFDGGRVFISSGDAVYALNADGSPAWHAESGTLVSPLLAQDGWVIVVTKDQLAALRGADGSVVWRRPIDPTSERPSIDGGNLFVPLQDGRVVALELSSGNPRWERRLRATPTEVLPFPDRVYVGAADKFFYCLDADDGEIVWRQRVGAALRGRPAADDSRVYVVALDNLLRAFDRRTGSLRWSPRGLPSRPTAGPAVMGRLVVVAGTTNEVRAFDGAGGQPAGLLQLPESLATLPAYSVVPGTVRIAAVTGSLTQQWALSLVVPAPPPVPSLGVEPLTALPGLLVPSPRPPG